MERLRLFFFSACAVTAVGFAYFAALAVGTDNSGPEVLAANRAEQDVASGTYTFLTWHNGSKRHDVWGVGTIFAAASAGTVKCGDRSITVTPVYDTKADHRYPKTEQTKVFAKAYNRTVLELLETRGVSCEF